MERVTVEYLVGKKLRTGSLFAKDIKEAEERTEKKFPNWVNIYFPDKMQSLEQEMMA